MVAFIPDKIAAQTTAVPYFEDSQNVKIPGADLRKPLDYYQKQIEYHCAGKYIDW